MDAFKSWSRPVQITVGIIVGLLAIVLFVIFFGTAEDDPVDDITPTSSASPSQAAPTPSATPEASPVEPEDVTDWVREARPDKADLVTSATRDTDGFIEVATSIVDPRVDGLSPEGTDALSICVGIADAGAENGRVLETDGTTFVTLRDGVCAEQ